MDVQAIRDIETRYIQTQADLKDVKAQIANKQLNIKLNQATEKQLKSAISDNKTRVWRGVGKMFSSITAQEYYNELEKEKKSSEESLDALSKKLRYLEQSYENLTKAITEISKRLGGQVPAS